MPAVSRAMRSRLRSRRLQEAGPEQEILGRIAGHRELGEQHQVDLVPARLVQTGEDPLAVPVEVSDDGVHLSERRAASSSLTIPTLRRKVDVDCRAWALWHPRSH